jgi:competence protein ComEC
LTHWDFDHLSGLQKIKSWPQLCHEAWPAGSETLSARKTKLIQDLPACLKNESAEDFPIFHIYNPVLTQSSSSNGLSNVYLANNFLIPGDSTAQEEIKWMHNFLIQKTKVLILGHHGSRSSTSKELLQHLPFLKMAVASQRWIRYRHPHPLVIKRLKTHGIPLVLTEDWGNLHFLN